MPVEIKQLFLFGLSILGTILIPGYFILKALDPRRALFSLLERFAIAFPLGLAVLDAWMLILNKGGIMIGVYSVWLPMIFLIILLRFVYAWRLGRGPLGPPEEEELFSFSPNQLRTILLIIFLAIFVRSIYLSANIFPLSTDLGHHMYWSQEIADSGRIPEYNKRDIIVSDGRYAISEPEPISDFIVGEHLPFAAILALTGIPATSFFPIIFLLIVDLSGLAVFFCLALRLFSNWSTGRNMAIFALLLIAAIFSLSPPQAKYLAGGVVGNILGNLLFLTTAYFVVRYFGEKRPSLMTLALFSAMMLFFTHHLTGLILLLALILSIIVFGLVNLSRIGQLLREYGRPLLAWQILLFAVFAAFFVVWVYTPSYLKNTAVDKVVGEVTKEEHGGLTTQQFRYVVGEPRFALGLAGILVCLWLVWRSFRERNNLNVFGPVLLLGWSAVILAISLIPQVIRINIPSARVANYGSYPLALIGGLVFFTAFGRNRSSLNRTLAISTVTILILFSLSSGFFDDGEYRDKYSPTDTSQAFAIRTASQYLAERIAPADWIVQDHINLRGDSWTKLYFKRDYNFPLFRALLVRYENNDRSEKCTLWMISDPTTPDSRRCFEELNVRYTLVDPRTDAAQFEKDSTFWKVFDTDKAVVFYRSNYAQ